MHSASNPKAILTISIIVTFSNSDALWGSRTPPKAAGASVLISASFNEILPNTKTV
jgi:hypothetical protein